MIGGAILELYEAFIIFFTFLLLNFPIFISLYEYLFKDLNLFAKLAIGVLYWSFAFLAHELVPFIGVLILLYRVHGKAEDEMQTRDINIWSIGPPGHCFCCGWHLGFQIDNKPDQQVICKYFEYICKYGGQAPGNSRGICNRRDVLQSAAFYSGGSAGALCGGVHLQVLHL